MYKCLVRVNLTIVCLFLLAGTAGAQSIEEAHTLYAEGRFIEAADLARVLDTSEGYALAANSLAIYGYYIAPDSEKGDLFMRATEFARKAIRLDATNPEAHLQLAHAMGRQAQTIGKMKALNEGYASKVRDSIHEALRLDPDMADAHLSLGAWHAGAVSTGGFFAGMLYGAKKKDALAYFERALELAPQEKEVLLEYALGLLSLDAHDSRGKARDLLARMISIPPKDAYEWIIHRQAVEQLSSLDGA